MVLWSFLGELRIVSDKNGFSPPPAGRRERKRRKTLNVYVVSLISNKSCNLFNNSEDPEVLQHSRMLHCIRVCTVCQDKKSSFAFVVVARHL